MTVAQALQDGTVTWRAARRDGTEYELTDGDDTIGRAGLGRFEIDDRTFRLRAQRDQIVFVDEATSDRRAVLRPLSSGPAVLSVGSGRYRLARRGVIPLFWRVTVGLGGPQVLEVLQLPGRLKVRGGDALAQVPPDEQAMLVAAVAVLRLGLIPGVPLQAARAVSDAALNAHR